MSVSPPPTGVPPPYSYSHPSSTTLNIVSEPTPMRSTSESPGPSTPGASTAQWVSFEGKPHEDCGAFIQSVKRHAFSQGKQRDDAWIVDYCETGLKGEALRWFLELDEATTASWKALQLALLARFGHAKLGRPTSMSPAPRMMESEVALSRRRSSSVRTLSTQSIQTQRFRSSLPAIAPTIGRARLGYLQVVNDVTWAPLGYVSAHLQGGRFGARASSAEALRVELVESEKMHDLKLLNAASEYDFLGLTMFSKNCPVSETSNGPVYPSATEYSIRPQMIGNSYNDTSLSSSTVWKVQSNGLVTAFWPSKTGALLELACCGYTSTTGNTAPLLTFLPDPATFLAANPAWAEVVLVFQERTL